MKTRNAVWPGLLATAAWLGSGPALARETADEPAVEPPAVVVLSSSERLSLLGDDEVRAAIEALRRQHIDGPSLDEPALARATLRGLLSALEPGAELTGGTPSVVPEAPFLAEALDERVGYLRLGLLSSENVAALDAALEEFREAQLAGVVLDLRATPESQNFVLAAEVAARFVPAGTPLFTLVQPGRGSEEPFVASAARVFPGVVVVVVDGQTAGAAEVLAGVLRRQARALLVGAPTRGRAVEFAEVPLGPEHHLRLAAGRAVVPGLPPLHPHGLAPDVAVAQEAGLRDQVLAGALSGGVAPFVFERERAQLNEAALVAGTNPEIGAETITGVIDRPLQRAVDLVTAITLLPRGD